MTRWAIVPLTRQHDRNGFDCGREELNEYLRRHARQNMTSGVSVTHVATLPDSMAVVGYYSICTGSIRLRDLPEADRRRLPAYPVPTAHLGKLAVDLKHQGQGLGGVLLFDALERTTLVADQVGIHAFTVIACDERARSFYEHYGFRPLASAANHLFLAVRTTRDLLLSMESRGDD